MKITDINVWKANTISTITADITSKIASHTAPFNVQVPDPNDISGSNMIYPWIGHESEAINSVVYFINSLKFTRTLTADIIKQQILTVYTYISIKYLSLIKDPIVAAKVAIPHLIDGTSLYPNEDDFRNLFIESKELPELDINSFIFNADVIMPEATEGGVGGTGTCDLSVSAGVVYTTLKTNLDTTWAATELNFWESLPNKVQPLTMTKIMYMMFNKPVMSSPDLSQPNDPKEIILDTMHFREAITASPFKDTFTSIFPELS